PSMATIKSQIKRNRQNEKRRKRNQGVRSSLKTATKRATTAAESGDAEAAAVVREASRAYDKAASKGMLHKRAAPGQQPSSPLDGQGRRLPRDRRDEHRKDDIVGRPRLQSAVGPRDAFVEAGEILRGEALGLLTVAPHLPVEPQPRLPGGIGGGGPCPPRR